MPVAAHSAAMPRSVRAVKARVYGRSSALGEGGEGGGMISFISEAENTVKVRLQQHSSALKLPGGSGGKEEE